MYALACLCYALANMDRPPLSPLLAKEGKQRWLATSAVIDGRYSNMDEKNKLHFGDNLKILRDYVEDASVDLI